MKLTVFFEGQFWVGVIEDAYDGKLRAYRHIFGAEPYDADVNAFVQHEMLKRLENISQNVDVKHLHERRINSKRLAKQAAEETAGRGISDKAKLALMKELEHRKKVRQVITREMREAEKERKREIAAQKAKAKHRGR
ncbi:DUF2992 family protein [Paenibacillus albiflavus]|uniref:DUF2992 family protein n=1 Tax=Paenibacillus albiflavus TaxID=2545760 RepID=A0A4R4EE36_9BACL|nr:YjdF family protein [Paenibacillus albiflavus]TCZ77707.1 DUF2992 family protein [Paenibacillus albiflavus]